MGFVVKKGFTCCGLIRLILCNILLVDENPELSPFAGGLSFGGVDKLSLTSRFCTINSGFVLFSSVFFFLRPFMCSHDS